MQKQCIIVQDISQFFMQGTQQITVLDHISIQFSQQKTYAIAGASGSGKSTLLHITAGLDKPSSGKIIYDGTDIYALQPHNLSLFLNQQVGLVFQSPYLLRELSIIENVMLPGLIKRDSEKNIIARAEFLLEKVGILAKKDSRPGELSGGQQQRAAIARALFNQPSFLIADEPTSNLDPATGKSIIDLLLSLHQDWGMGIIISSHDEYVSKNMNEIYTLDKGKLTHTA